MGLNRRATRRLAKDVPVAEVMARSLPSEETPNSSQTRPRTASAPRAQYMPRDVLTLPKARQPAGAPKILAGVRHGPDLILGGGRKYIQNPNLPWLNPQESREGLDGADTQKVFDFYGFDAQMGIENYEVNIPSGGGISRYQRKKANQWRTWAISTIPSLVEPYLKLLQDTLRLRNPIAVPDTISCPCGQFVDSLTVTVVFWQELRDIRVDCCPCHPTATLLVDHGLFPAAPLRPSLAVDINMLEFVSELSMRSVPNNTAWCQTLNHLLTQRGYAQVSDDSLRRRFGNASHWYTVLINATRKYVDLLVARERPTALAEPEVPDEDFPPVTSSSCDESSPSPCEIRSGCDGPTNEVPESSPGPAYLAGSGRADEPLSCPSLPCRRPTIETVVDEDDPFHEPCSTNQNQRSNVDKVVDGTSAPPPSQSTRDPSSPRGSPDGSPAPSLSGSECSPVNVLGERLGQDPVFHKPQGSRASEYLRSRCAACFGGEFHVEAGAEASTNTPERPGVIVQIDANFGHKRRHVGNDPPFVHPYSHFLDEKDVEAMEAAVEAARPSRKQAPDKRKRATAHTEDVMEATGLPRSVLDTCETTFEAADSRRQKASTQFFDDTGSMAILCRHDHVLFLANMKSAGEKQHYALALLKAVLDSLPEIVVLGALYDIGCQTHRSVVKWGFLVEYTDRLVFGLSIFHAYGHEWPCQLIYSPRKRVGFGLSNGEGCERLWSALKDLIPNLRVSGHFRRIYMLDEQIEYLHQRSHPKLGLWLARTFAVAENKILDNQEILDGLGIDVDRLRTEWAHQVAAQTKPLPSQSKSRSKHAMEKVMRVRQELDKKSAELTKLEERRLTVLEDDPLDATAEDLELEICDLKAHRDRLLLTLSKQTKALGISEQQSLKSLMASEYLVLRVNMRAKKQRIRERIRRRKFELSRVERSHRHSVNERKIVDHSEEMISRREPTISRLVSEYNKCCSQMEHLIQRKKVPRGVEATIPEKIDPKKLFSLEVDDTLWQDVGLEDDTDGIPAWLGDEDVREGIIAMLELDRAREEVARLTVERTNLQCWFVEEWEAVQRAVRTAERKVGRGPITFSLEGRLDDLLNLCNTWRSDVDRLPGTQDIPEGWGPPDNTLGTLAKARQARKERGQRHLRRAPPPTELRVDTEEDDRDSSDDDQGSKCGEVAEEAGLVEALEAVELGEQRWTERAWDAHAMSECEETGPSGFVGDGDQMVSAKRQRLL